MADGSTFWGKAHEWKVLFVGLGHPKSTGQYVYSREKAINVSRGGGQSFSVSASTHQRSRYSLCFAKANRTHGRRHIAPSQLEHKSFAEQADRWGVEERGSAAGLKRRRRLGDFPSTDSWPGSGAPRAGVTTSPVRFGPSISSIQRRCAYLHPCIVLTIPGKYTPYRAGNRHCGYQTPPAHTDSVNKAKLVHTNAPRWLVVRLRFGGRRVHHHWHVHGVPRRTQFLR